MPEHPRGQLAAERETLTALAQVRVPDAETLTAVADGLERLPAIGEADRPVTMRDPAAPTLRVRGS